MTLDIAPLTGTLGAEVRGVDLARVDDTTRDELRKAWLDHKVLVFGDQRIGVDEHIAFAQRFGTVDARPVDDGSGTPQELTVIHTDGESGFVASEWHGDVTSDQHPALGAVLRARIVPSVGGDTCWADTAAAYDRLSADWKARIADLEAVHPTLGVRHPVVWAHPETGAPAIYTNRYFGHRIDGVSAQEGAAITAHLERAIMDPSVQCRVRWEVDTVVMSDNRCTQHCATDDYFPYERRMERVALVDG